MGELWAWGSCQAHEIESQNFRGPRIRMIEGKRVHRNLLCLVSNAKQPVSLIYM